MSRNSVSDVDPTEVHHNGPQEYIEHTSALLDGPVAEKKLLSGNKSGKSN